MLWLVSRGASTRSDKKTQVRRDKPDSGTLAERREGSPRPEDSLRGRSDPQGADPCLVTWAHTCSPAWGSGSLPSQWLDR